MMVSLPPLLTVEVGVGVGVAVIVVGGGKVVLVGGAVVLVGGLVVDVGGAVVEVGGAVVEVAGGVVVVVGLLLQPISTKESTSRTVKGMISNLFTVASSKFLFRARYIDKRKKCLRWRVRQDHGLLVTFAGGPIDIPS